MSFTGDILFLDIARTIGWCEGPLRGPLRYGSVEVAPAGSSSGAIFFGTMRFIATRLQAFKPRVIAFEAPLDPRILKKTTRQTIRILNGMPACVEGIAYGHGIYDVREAEVADVKYFWLGSRRIPRDQSKRMIRDKLRELGYDPKDLDASDAIAGHRFICAEIDHSIRSEPLALLKGA